MSNDGSSIEIIDWSHGDFPLNKKLKYPRSYFFKQLFLEEKHVSLARAVSFWQSLLKVKLPPKNEEMKLKTHFVAVSFCVHHGTKDQFMFFFLLLFFSKVHNIQNSAVSHKSLQFISNVSFIPYFVFCFSSLLALELRKYKNITYSLFTFCKARWAWWKKTERKSRNWSDQNTQNQTSKIWDERTFKKRVRSYILFSNNFQRLLFFIDGSVMHMLMSTMCWKGFLKHRFS